MLKSFLRIQDNSHWWPFCPALVHVKTSKIIQHKIYQILHVSHRSVRSVISGSHSGDYEHCGNRGHDAIQSDRNLWRFRLNTLLPLYRCPDDVTLQRQNTNKYTVRTSTACYKKHCYDRPIELAAMCGRKLQTHTTGFECRLFSPHSVSSSAQFCAAAGRFP
jgi:hypothetical protein